MVPASVVTTVRELCEESHGLAVVLLDYDGTAIATGGDVSAFPEGILRGLSGRALETAGSLLGLLQRLAADNPQKGGPFYQVNLVGRTHILAVAYDDDADPNLPAMARRAAATILDALRASLS